MSDLEIIDLTSSPAEKILDVDELASSLQNDVSQESRRKRKRRVKKSTANYSPNGTASHSRRTSVEREPETVSQNKRKRREPSPEASRNQDLYSRNLRQTDEKVNEPEDQAIFFVDLSPAPIPPARLIVTEGPIDQEPQDLTKKLLVPSHVTVLGSTPVEIIPEPLSDLEDNNFIKYLDYDDSKHTMRYYEDLPTETTTLSRTVCKNCGAEGEHKTSACPVQICLTCGVRDEHSTRSCPISKVCFTCGMKGHVNANCPNRRSAHALMATKETDCDRCSSSRHKTNECPTLWRLYEYFTGQDQTQTLTQRQSKRDFKLGQGGEGYVADDEWCYYCGSYGHWGDDCHDLIWGQFSEEFSAFSKYNVMNGPFYDPRKELKQTNARSRPSDSEKEGKTSSWPQDAPADVGRRARMKSRAALERQAREVEEDPDDWFGNASRRNGTRLRESKTIAFGKSVGGGRPHEPPGNDPPSLMARIGDYQREDLRPKRRDYSARRGRRHHESSDRYPHGDSGPRYRGGYTR
ncbi:hypothetical protein GALMADRAFT_671498 [Galerina marginata CBS 339.88]|uniref:CCHC-type domain-containing protein n=1 Tax=Galerina marginata (strain CBS 339.88) TaxID=685588 RepID=A0A067TXK2_GALM3|nr:hypothetical protein GALMADRAFT_671498 [Galerina marginata CBS 339.88]